MAPRARRPRLVTLTSDVGSAYAAQMKGVLLRTLPPGHVVDLTHDLPPHAVSEAAFVVRTMAAAFPAGTVHVVIVDPGVGSARAPIAVGCRDGSVLVGPDNGVLLPLARELGFGSAHRIDPGRLRSRPRVGRTFDGRDLFAPAAAEVAAGRPVSQLGPTIRPVDLVLPEPRRRAAGADGAVVHVDRFGNLISNIPSEWVPGTARHVRVAGRRGAVPWVDHYAALGLARLGALGSSFGTVELAVREGSAERRLEWAVGDPVALRWRPGRVRATRTVNSDRPRRR